MLWPLAREPWGDLVDGQLEYFTFEMIGEKEHLDSFRAKFGQESVEQMEVKNSQGASWIGHIYKWQGPDSSTITIDCTGFGTRCVVEIETLAAKNRRAVRDSKRRPL